MTDNIHLWSVMIRQGITVNQQGTIFRESTLKGVTVEPWAMVTKPRGIYFAHEVA